MWRIGIHPRCSARDPRRRAPLGPERSTALMLAPALVMVLLVLGSVGVDMTLVHSARRSAYRSLSAAADDAAAMVDSREFQRSGRIQIDPEAASRVARAHLGLLDGDVPPGFAEPAFRVLDARVSTDVAAGVVRIEADVLVEHVLGPAVPGVQDTTTISMEVTGRML